MNHCESVQSQLHRRCKWVPDKYRQGYIHSPKIPSRKYLGGDSIVGELKLNLNTPPLERCGWSKGSNPFRTLLSSLFLTTNHEGPLTKMPPILHVSLKSPKFGKKRLKAAIYFEGKKRKVLLESSDAIQSEKEI